jgi:predicted DNA-binding protein
MLSIELSPEVERRLSELARHTGRSEDACVRELIEEHLADLEDLRTAEARLRERQPSLSGRRVREELGFDR